MRPLNEYRRFDGSLRYANGHDNTGLEEIRVRQQECEAGSASLKERINKSINRFASRYGISQIEALHLLLNTGVRL